jgi:hypothetical protein
MDLLFNAASLLAESPRKRGPKEKEKGAVRGLGSPSHKKLKIEAPATADPSTITITPKVAEEAFKVFNSIPSQHVRTWCICEFFRTDFRRLSG